MIQKFLGKKTSDYSKGSAKSLDPIFRKSSDIIYGVDYWNAYEFSYIDHNSMPVLKVLEIKIPSDSLQTVESKSLKIYLNSFYKKKFSNTKNVFSKIKKDLDKVTQSNVQVSFIKSFKPKPLCIDINTSKLISSKVNSPICFIGFRSICPVTSQPDFANIYIASDTKMNLKWLKSYLKSYREKGEFHEQCIEDIFNGVMKKYACTKLEVAGRFMRRGGIDINPVRSTHKKLFFNNFRFFNQ